MSSGDATCHKINDSSALECWERWVHARKQVHQKLGGALKLNAGELLMNSAEEVRNVNEEKILLNNAKITRNFDKYRGNPMFFDLPPGLKAKDGVDCDHFYAPTKEQRNELTDIEYVGTPNAIAKEKNILPRQRNAFTTWKSLSYLKEQEKKLDRKLKKLEPHKPDYSDLAIIGKQITGDCEFEMTVEERSFSLSWDNVLAESTPRNTLTEERPSEKNHFFINDIEISDPNERLQRTRKICLFFDHDIHSNSLSELHLKLENRGAVTMRVYFRKYEKVKLFRDITAEINMKPFYFNKDEIIILPNHTVKLPIWFKARILRNYQEYWELYTKPNLWDREEFRLIIMLQGTTSSSFLQKQAERIKSNLRRIANKTFCENIVDSLLDKINYAQADVAVSEKFGEKQMFESVNVETITCLAQSKYKYVENTVGLLKEFYLVVKHPNDSKCWNYSIADLKEITRKRDIVEYVEAKTLQRIKMREKRLELEKVRAQLIEKTRLEEQAKGKSKIKEKSKKIEKKKSKEPSKKGTPKEVPFEESVLELTPSYYNKLQELLAKLEQPSVSVNIEREKYLHCFHVVRSVFTKMDFALEELTEQFNISPKIFPNFSATAVPDRMIYERFDDSYVNRMKRVCSEQKTDFPCKPKTHLLYGIPPNDSENIYSIYFNKPLEITSKKLGKKSQSDIKSTKTKSKTSLKTSELKTSKKGKADSVSKARKLSIFDPFIEEFSLPSIPSRTTEENRFSNNVAAINSNLSINDLREYKRLQYLTIYENLLELVSSLVDSLNTCNEKQISNELFSDLMQNQLQNTCAFCEDQPKNSPTEAIEPRDEMPFASEDEKYFNTLLTNHWLRNNQTKRYLLKGVVKESVQQEIKEMQQAGERNNEVPPPFDPSDYVPKFVEYVPVYRENYSQTCTCIDLSQFFDSNSTDRPTSPIGSDEENSQQEIFYHVNPDKFPKETQ